MSNADSIGISWGMERAVSSLSLPLSDALSYEQWAELARPLGLMVKASRWWLGDWLVFGENHYGELYAQAIDDTELSEGTLRSCAWLARKFEPFRRRKGLSWSHHAEVGRQAPETADMLLDWAVREDWTCDQLRAVIAEAKAAPDLTLLPSPRADDADEPAPVPEWAEHAATLPAPTSPPQMPAPTADGPAPRLSLVGPARAECPPLLSVGLEVASVSRLVGVLWRRSDGGVGTFLLPEALMADCGPVEVGGHYRLVVTEEGRP